MSFQTHSGQRIAIVVFPSHQVAAPHGTVVEPVPPDTEPPCPSVIVTDHEYEPYVLLIEIVTEAPDAPVVLPDTLPPAVYVRLSPSASCPAPVNLNPLVVILFAVNVVFTVGALFDVVCEPVFVAVPPFPSFAVIVQLYVVCPASPDGLNVTFVPAFADAVFVLPAPVNE